MKKLIIKELPIPIMPDTVNEVSVNTHSIRNEKIYFCNQLAAFWEINQQETPDEAR
jgi:hypothetical protein